MLDPCSLEQEASPGVDIDGDGHVSGDETETDPEIARREGASSKAVSKISPAWAAAGLAGKIRGVGQQWSLAPTLEKSSCLCLWVFVFVAHWVLLLALWRVFHGCRPLSSSLVSYECVVSSLSHVSRLCFLLRHLFTKIRKGNSPLMLGSAKFVQREVDESLLRCIDKIPCALCLLQADEGQPASTAVPIADLSSSVGGESVPTILS